MLRDVMFTVSPDMAYIFEVINGGPTRIERLQEGVYVGHLNLHSEINRNFVKDEYPRWDDWKFNAYGVCDTPEQMLEYYKEVLADPDRNFSVCFHLICREDQSPDGGWRWHKWGPYIGEQNPKCEYLYDEPDIDEIYVFHVTELVKPTPREIWDEGIVEVAKETGAINNFD